MPCGFYETTEENVFLLEECIYIWLATCIRLLISFNVQIPPSSSFVSDERHSISLIEFRDKGREAYGPDPYLRVHN